MIFSQEWEGKAAKLKDDYTKAVQEFEKNGGDKNAGSGGAKKRSKAPAKKPVKKSKKKDSEEEEEEDESD